MSEPEMREADIAKRIAIARSMKAANAGDTLDHEKLGEVLDEQVPVADPECHRCHAKGRTLKAGVCEPCRTRAKRQRRAREMEARRRTRAALAEQRKRDREAEARRRAEAQLDQLEDREREKAERLALLQAKAEGESWAAIEKARQYHSQRMQRARESLASKQAEAERLRQLAHILRPDVERYREARRRRSLERMAR